MAPGKGWGKVQRPQHRPWDSTFESAHHRAGSRVFTGVILRQSYCPVTRGFGLGGVGVTQHAIHLSVGGAGLPTVSGQAGGGRSTLPTGPSQSNPGGGAAAGSSHRSCRCSGRPSCGGSGAKPSWATRPLGRHGPGHRRHRTRRGCQPAARCAPSASP